VVLLRLFTLTGETVYRQRAEGILRLFYEAARENPFAYLTLLEALELYSGEGTEIVLVGGSPSSSAFDRVIAGCYLPHLTLVRTGVDDSSPPPLARGRLTVDGQPTAYVCRHFTCSRPLVSPDELRDLLGEPRQRP
jgi:uncharacterized protein YyaL (SSP411 family)